MLSKLFYFKIFLIWMVMNPAGVLFGLSTVTAIAMGARIAIHPQVSLKPSLDRELGQIETHLQATDDRAKAQSDEVHQEINGIQHDREEKRSDTEKWRVIQTELLDRIAKRFDADEQDARMLRERTIGDEKVVFGFVICISFFGGIGFLKRFFTSRASVALTEVQEIPTTKKASSYRRTTARRSR